MNEKEDISRDEQQDVQSLAKKIVIILSVIYGTGIYLTITFFFSVIVIAIGAMYFFALKNRFWKRAGLIMIWTASISAFVVAQIAMNNVLGNPSISTVYLSMIIGPVSTIIGIAILLLGKRWKRVRASIPGWFSKVKDIKKGMLKRSKVLGTLFIIALPMAIWTYSSIDLGVIFRNDVELLWVHGPTTVKQGAEFELTVEAWDSYERLSATYKGTIEFSMVSFGSGDLSPLQGVSAVLPSEYTFTGQAWGSDIAYKIQDGKDNGLHVFTARIDTPGIHYILATDSLTQNTYWSNPIVVKDYSTADEMIYWGDLHDHSALSDGSGTPEHHFYYAQNVALLDFNALTDHGETMGLIPGGLDWLERAANEAYEPGTFVAYPGIEWTNAEYGHYTCVMSGSQLIKDPLLSFFVVKTPQELWNALDAFTESTGSRVLALPHHTIKQEYPQDWSYLNPKYVKIAEVVSVHGECLFQHQDPYNYMGCGDPPLEVTYGTAIMDALKMGHKLALYGSSDEHDGHPGHSLSHTRAVIGHQRPWTIWPNRLDLPYPSGITAVRAFNLTREGVFTGLENQRVYASSDHGRPYLEFSINGQAVGDGSTVSVSSVTSARQIRVLLAQDGAPAADKFPKAASVVPGWMPEWKATVEIFKNGELFYSKDVSGAVSEVLVSDSSSITGASFGEQCILKADGKYYLNEYSDNPVNPDELNTGGSDFYLVRFVGENGRYAYAGPIWVEIS